MRKLLILSALFLMFGNGAPAAADEHSWQLGLAAFANEDYESALVFFQTALDAGQTGPAVHYNIGVCQFKIGRYEDAGRTFRRLGDEFPAFRALAEYNLGLIDRRQGRDEEALDHFRLAYAESGSDETLHKLASVMVDTLTPAPPPAPPRGYRALGIRAGYDDNVALRDELALPAGASQASPMADLFGWLEQPLGSAGGLSIEAGLYAVHYFDADDYDQNNIDAGLSWSRYFTDWRARIGAYGNYGTIGGNGFDRGLKLVLRLDRPLSKTSWLNLGYEYSDISAIDDLYAGIEGSRQKFDLGLRWYGGQHELETTLRYETNDRASASVSPDRLRLGFGYRFLRPDNWNYEVDVYYRASRYAQLTPARDEDYGSVRLGLSRKIVGDWILGGSYEYSSNDSTDSIYTYDRQRMTVGMLRTF